MPAATFQNAHNTIRDTADKDAQKDRRFELLTKTLLERDAFYATHSVQFWAWSQ